MLNETQILLRFQNFNKLYKKLQNDICDKYNISHIELDIILFLYNNPQHDTAKDLVQLRGIAKSYISKSIDLLLKKGLITTIEDEKDRRKIHIKIKDKSLNIVEEGKIVQSKFLNIIYKDISQEEKDNLQNILNKIAKNVEGVL